MPELPDVEVFRQYFNRTSLNRKIKSVDVEDSKILRGISRKRLSRELIGSEFRSSQRRGKYMFAGIKNGKWLMMHFGMTGFLKYFKNEDSAPEHPRVFFSFTNGYRLAYDSQRKLGRIKLIESMEDFVRKNELGVDALDPELDYQLFRDIVSKRRGMAKTLLMNQSVISGIGNIYSDEILFQSGINPKQEINGLSGRKIKKLYVSMKKVLNTAIERRVDTGNFPGSFLIPHRKEGDKCPRCGGRVKKIKVNNRGTYLCPRCQR